MTKISDLNPTFAIVWFIVTTLLYGIFKYLSGLITIPDNSTKPININEEYNNEKTNNNFKMLIYGYLLFTILSEFFISLDLSKKMCGEPQFNTALMATIIPWGLIFTTIIVLLNLFPGWLSPFSNTIGYILTVILGIKDIFNELLDPEPKNKKHSDFIKTALQHITMDKSILINEITIENFETFWNNMTPIFKENKANDNNLKLDLFNLVRVKTIVSEVVWYILTGLLILSVSFNNILNTNCEKNLENMKKAKLDYEIAKYKENKRKETKTTQYYD